MSIRDVFWAGGLALLLAHVASPSFAQSAACDNALDLCGQVDTTATLNAPLDLPGASALQGLFDVNNVQVIHFHTTFFGQFAEPTEPVEVSFSGVECSGPLLARVFQSNPLDDCSAGEYVPVSEAWTFSQDTVLTSDALFQNTDYVLLVGAVNNGCAVNVELGGIAMSIDACCTSSIDYGETTTVEVLGSDPDLGYVWTPEELAEMVDNQLAELSPYETTTFEVTGYIQGCAYSDAVLVAVGSPINVPNAFSPNNDAFNDTWNIFGLSQFPTSTIEVFDRWGQNVYRSVSYPNPWGGKNRGVDVPAGTYYYVIHLNEPNANLAPVTGHVAVIR